MSAELYVPAAALDALGVRARGPHRGLRSDVRAIAAPVVAAELRRIANRLCAKDARDLLDRAEELDGAT